MHDILLVQFTCLTVLFHTSLQVLFGLPPGLGPSTSETIQFFTESSSFLNTCPYHRSLFCCNTNAMSSIPSLSHSSLLGNLSFTLMPHIYLTILMCHLIFFPYNRTKLNTTNIIAVSKNKVYVKNNTCRKHFTIANINKYSYLHVEQIGLNVQNTVKNTTTRLVHRTSTKQTEIPLKKTVY